MPASQDKELEDAVQGIYSGSLSAKIKKNASYAIGGMFVGGVIGMMIASFIGKPKWMGIVVGAAVAGVGGYGLANRKEEEKEL